MEKLNARLINQAADVKEAQDDVIKELEEKVLFLSAKASSVENDRNELLTAMEKSDKLRDTEKKSLELEINRLTDDCKQLKSMLQQPASPFVTSNFVADDMKSDPDAVREELKKQRTMCNSLREHNTKLLYRLQTALGNIQVYCRTRPPLHS
jgi:chromosome segregation ATPase